MWNEVLLMAKLHIVWGGMIAKGFVAMSKMSTAYASFVGELAAK
jgi:hypothetical protein